MARPRTARLQTAYDLGHEHGRTGSRPRNADDIIGDDPDMQQAYDDGLVAGTDNADTGPAEPVEPADEQTPRPRAHRTNPASGRRQGSPSGARAAAGTSKTGGSSARFSHPLHWGSGARGHVTGRPTLRPPSSLSIRDWTGFGFGLILFALASSYIDYGPGGPTRWFKAKFLNDTGSGAGGTASGGAVVVDPKDIGYLKANGYVPPTAIGQADSFKVKGGYGGLSIQASDGLWYPLTKKGANLPALTGPSGASG